MASTRVLLCKVIAFTPVSAAFPELERELISEQIRKARFREARNFVSDTLRDCWKQLIFLNLFSRSG